MRRNIPGRALRLIEAALAEAIVRRAPDPGEAEQASGAPTVVTLRTDRIRRRIAPGITRAYQNVHGFDFRYHRDGSRAHGLVLDGPWDRFAVPALSVEDHAAFREHFIGGRPWEETSRYRQMTRNGAWERRAAWMRKTAFWDRLHDEMRTGGYRRQDEVRSDLRLGNSKLEGSALNEIQVAITRTGEVLRVGGGGNHRFLLATLLGIEEIPVVVNAWHAKLRRSDVPQPRRPRFRPVAAEAPGVRA